MFDRRPSFSLDGNPSSTMRMAPVTTKKPTTATGANDHKYVFAKYRPFSEVSFEMQSRSNKFNEKMESAESRASYGAGY
jgi:hypothetical protein